MIWRVNMISLGHKGNRWWVVLGYNIFYSLCCVDVMLRIRYINIWWYMRGRYVKYTVWRLISNARENMANIVSTGCRIPWRYIWRSNGGSWYLRYVGWGDWLRKVAWLGVLWGYFWGIFWSGGCIDKMNGLCVYGSKCQRRCLFSGLTLNRISVFFV